MHKTIKKLVVLLAAIMFLQVPSFANSKAADQRKFIISNLPQGCVDVSYENGYAYAAEGETGLSVYDIKQAGTARRVGGISFQAYIDHVSVAGDYAYLMADDELFIVSVSNPEKPVCLFKHKLPGLELCYGIGADSTNLYLLYNDRLDIYALEDPLCPVLKTTYKSWQLTGGAAFTGIAVRGGILYLTLDRAGLVLFDFTDKDNIKSIGNFLENKGVLNMIYFNGNLAFARNIDKKSLEVLDITNIINPRYIGVVSDLNSDMIYYASIDEKVEMAVTPTPTPAITQPGPTETPKTSKGNKDKVAYLTIDDGPSRSITPGNLDTLKKYGVKATFFVLPRSNVDDIYKRILEEGHVIGNHSYSHDYNYLLQSTDNFRNDVVKARDFIYNKLNYTSTVFRFPGGKMGRTSYEVKERTDILSDLGYRYFGWDVSLADTDPNLSKYGTTDQIVNILVNNAVKGVKGRNKPIILMHDSAGKKYSAKALPKIIEALDKMGYSFDVLTNY